MRPGFHPAIHRYERKMLKQPRGALSAPSLPTLAVDEHQPLARERNVTLAVGAPTVDRAVAADPDRVQLVLSNLVINALRHTPPDGRVEVRAAPDDGFVRFEVSDSGPGIPAEYLPRLFERFFRIPGGSTSARRWSRRTAARWACRAIPATAPSSRSRCP